MMADELKVALIAGSQDGDTGLPYGVITALIGFLLDKPVASWQLRRGDDGLGELEIIFGDGSRDYFDWRRWPGRDLSATVSWIPEDFFWTCGRCALSGHVTIGPDYNGPHRERLLKEWPEHQFHEGFSADLEPGGSVDRVCHAICYALIDMTIAKRKLGL